VGCVWFWIHDHLFDLFLLSREINTYLWHGALVIHMTLLICLPSFYIYLFIILIPAYVYLNIYTHFPPIPYTYTFLAIFTCIVCVMLHTYNHVFVWILLFPKLDRHLCYSVYWCDHTPTHILILWLRQYFHFVICTSTMSKSNIKLLLLNINNE